MPRAVLQWLRPASDWFPGGRLLELGDVDLLHAQYRFHHAFAVASSLVLEQVRHHARHDLPRDAVAVLQPTALLGLRISALRELVPVEVDLGLHLAEHLKRNGF